MALKKQSAPMNSSLRKMNISLNWRLLMALSANMAFWVLIIVNYGHPHLYPAHGAAVAAIHSMT